MEKESVLLKQEINDMEERLILKDECHAADLERKLDELNKQIIQKEKCHTDKRAQFLSQLELKDEEISVLKVKLDATQNQTLHSAMETEKTLNKVETISEKGDSVSNAGKAVLCLGRVSQVEQKLEASEPVGCYDFVKVLSRTACLEEKNAVIERKIES